MATIIDFVVFAIIGLFGTNGIPHFVRGVTGQRHMSPFGSDSSPVVNVIWGSVNFAVAGYLGWRYQDAIGEMTLAVAFVAGVALAVGLASYWSAENPRLPWE